MSEHDSQKQNSSQQAAATETRQRQVSDSQEVSIEDNRLDAKAQQAMQAKMTSSASPQQAAISNLQQNSIQPLGSHSPLPAVAQLQIGDAGKALVGAQVIEDGKKRPWTIKSVRGEGEELEYELDLSGLMQQWVKYNDESWSIHEEEEVELDEATLELAELIEGNLHGDIDGEIDSEGFFLVEMADIHNSKNGAWSGGASDCVIVGGFTGEKVMMTHADRTSTALAKNIIAKCPTIYLASEVFGKGGEAAICNGNVREIVDMIVEAGKPLVVFNSTRMAISGAGQVYSSFDNA